MKKFLLISLFLINFKYLLPEIGCMDNSQHGDKNHGYDYKSYHYVNCTCPCQRYLQFFDRGRCFKCGHFRDLSS